MFDPMEGGFRRAVQVTRPARTAVVMAGFLLVVGLVAFLLYQPIAAVFSANPWLNGLILVVLAVGVGYTFWQVSRLNRCVDWIEAFIEERPGFETIEPPRMLASMAGMLRDPESRRNLSATTVRAILDSIATRLDEARDIARYAANLLIFLGLLGTFWGLSITVPAVVQTIRELGPGTGGESVFTRLVANLGTQMQGLGTAFASSLLGLAGSLIVGFLEILAGHAQNRFYRELEEALSRITYVGSTGEGGVSAVADNLARATGMMDEIARFMGEREVRAARAAEKVEAVSDRLREVTDRMEADEAALLRLSGSQDGLRLALEEATDRHKGIIGGMDAGTRARIESIDAHILRLVEELTAGRAESTAQIREELRHLTRTIEAAARGELEPAPSRAAGR